MPMQGSQGGVCVCPINPGTDTTQSPPCPPRSLPQRWVPCRHLKHEPSTQGAAGASRGHLTWREGGEGHTGHHRSHPTPPLGSHQRLYLAYASGSGESLCD